MKRAHPSVTLLRDGDVLIAGGDESDGAERCGLLRSFITPEPEFRAATDA